MKSKIIYSNSIEETLSLANKIGSRLRGGEIIELVGDLGAGKTTFVSGIAAGAGSDDVVSSPTFVISKRYKAPHLDLYHFDLYRLDQSDLIVHELKDLAKQDKVVTIIEWPGIIDSLIEENKIIIEFIYVSDINKREIVIKYDEDFNYLIK